MTKQKKTNNNLICDNKKARFDFTLSNFMEAGIVLQGWEVKSLRDSRVQLKESHIIIKHGEALLIGSHISPLMTAAAHLPNDPFRTRKLLLHKKELKQLIGHVERKGFTVVPIKLYWKQGRVKIEIALGKGKKTHDKRASIKERDWQRDKGRLLKSMKR